MYTLAASSERVASLYLVSARFLGPIADADDALRV